MARNTITDGPAMWQLMLVVFDEHPQNAHGTRDVHFELKCGFDFSACIHGVDHPDPSTSGQERSLWTLRGNTCYLPEGYYYSRHNALVIRYDPYRRKGYVDLELMCPSCGHTELRVEDRGAGEQMQVCTQCKTAAMRGGPGSDDWQWMNSESIRRHRTYGDSLKVRILSDPSSDL